MLVTKTQPDNADTGSTGVVDGYKNPAGDGWTNLEKYRRRTNPFVPDFGPAPIGLTQPTQMDLMKAFAQARQTDFRFETKMEIRSIRTKENYRSAQGMPPMFYAGMQRNAVFTDMQVRISVQVIVSG